MNMPMTLGPLANYRKKPVLDPVRAAHASRLGYRYYTMNFNALEQSEPMVELRDLGIKGSNHYASAFNPPYHQVIPGSTPDLWLRSGVAARLVAVNAALEPYDLELWIFDAWRPVAVQNYFFDHWMPNYLSNKNSNLKGEALTREVEKYWARGAADGAIDPASPPPHATGAAVDLTLMHKSGQHLHMGTIFDDVTEASNTEFLEKKEELSFSEQEALENRRLLYWTMADAGFVNNPTEWWHYSIGDQMWAKISGAKAAHYTAIQP